MLILIPLFLFVSLGVSDNNHQLTATALFYMDSQGRILLVSGELPKDTYLTIHEDLSSRAKVNLPIQVVPAYKNFDDIPFSENVLKVFKKRFKSIYSAAISNEKSKTIINDLRKFMSTNKTSNLLLAYMRKALTTSVFVNVNGSTSPSFHASSPQTNLAMNKPNPNATPVTVAYSAIMKKVLGHPPSTKIYWSQNEFVPNDIYYGIEKGCVNWNSACDLHGPSPYELASTYFNVPQAHLKPPIVQWVP